MIQNKTTSQKTLEERKKECDETLNQLDFGNQELEKRLVDLISSMGNCPECSSTLIKYYDSSLENTLLSCDECNHQDTVPEFLMLSHNQIKNGEDSVFEHCYECGGDTAIAGFCFNCGEFLDPNAESIEKFLYLMEKND